MNEKIPHKSIRPLTFLPATVLTVAGGLLFGPLQGLIFVLIGSSFANPRHLTFSLSVFILSLALVRILKNKKQH